MRAVTFPTAAVFGMAKRFGWALPLLAVFVLAVLAHAQPGCLSPSASRWFRSMARGSFRLATRLPIRRPASRCGLNPTLTIRTGRRSILPDWGYAWYRIWVPLALPSLAGSSTRLAFATFGRMDDAYQLFDHGELVGSWGRFSSRGESPVTYFTQPVMITLSKSPSVSPSDNGPAERVLAVRFWMGPVGLLHTPLSGGFHSAPLLGEAGAIATKVQLERQKLILQYYYSAFEFLVYLGLATLVSGPVFFDRSDAVYRWVAGCFLLFTLMSAIYIVAQCTQVISFRTFFVWFQVIVNPLSVGGWMMVWWWLWFRLRRPAWVPKAIAILTVAQMVTMAF